MLIFRKIGKVLKSVEKGKELRKGLKNSFHIFDLIKELNLVGKKQSIRTHQTSQIFTEFCSFLY